MSGLEEWVKLMESKGYSDKQLEDYLVKQGYNRDEIQSIVSETRKKIGPNHNMLWIILSAAVFIVLAIVVMNYYGVFDGFAQNTPVNTTSLPPPRIFGDGAPTNSNSGVDASIDTNASINSSINSSVNLSSNISNNFTNTPNSCGNGVLDSSEQCDGRDFGGKYCWDINSPVGNKFNGGQLQCNDDCTINTSSCTYCGDGIISTAYGEQCEIINGILFSTLTFKLGGVPHDWDLSRTNPCLNFGYASGTVSCDANCRLDSSQCYNKMDSKCGNGILEGNEQCDYNIPGPANASTCKSYTYTGSCFNNVTNSTSSCTLNFKGGSIQCTPECTQDLSDCYK